MKQLKGRLEFLGWGNRPWRVIAKNGKIIDLWPYFEEVFLKLNERRVKMQAMQKSSDAFLLCKAEEFESERLLLYKKELEGSSAINDYSLALKKIKRPASSNLIVYLKTALLLVNGRKIIVDILDDGISFCADPKEEVLGLILGRDKRYCKIQEGKELEVCQMGEEEKSCLFFSMIGRGKSICEKFNFKFAEYLLDVVAKGKRQKRIGNCALVGRK